MTVIELGGYRMANTQEMFCNYCKRETTFFLDSDMLWYCDECGNVHGSIPLEDIDDEYDNCDSDDVIRCPLCHNLVNISELEDGYLCPICFEDLSDKLEDVFGIDD